MKLKGKDCNGNCNGHWNTSKEKRHTKINKSKNWMNLLGVEESWPGSFVLRTSTILEMDHRRQKGVAKSALRPRAFLSSRRRGQVRGRREVVHHRELELTKIGGSAT